MKKFEIGEMYMANDCGFEPIRIVKRTPKCVIVEHDNGASWRMIIKYDPGCDCEYVTDSAVPKKWRPAFTYRADRNAKEWGWK